MRALLTAVLLMLPALAFAQPRRVAEGARYVAMGSSYAAGPGIGESANTPPTRCGRSADNYPHQAARRLHLTLVDVSCGGATTVHVLGPWSELPPQIDAVTADTRLVTVTIGGNDVSYVGDLIAASCPPPAAGAANRCPPVVVPDEATWTRLGESMRRIAAEVHRRAPRARLIFVDYPVVLPEHGLCAAVPIGDAGAALARATATRLAALTARVARESGAGLVRASLATRGHDACAADAWMNGAVPPHAHDGILYHPTLMGMSAVATALVREARR